MPDATKRPIAGWRETEWLQHLQQQAQRLIACPHSAADLAHTCLIAFYDHHRRYPWQHPEPAHALRWCCQKLRALACDAHRHAERRPCLALETLPETVACVDIAAQMQADIDGARFVASLPPRLRAAVELRLAGYSWDEVAQQLGVSASTLRGYWGYDFWTRDTVQHKTECIPPAVIDPCQRYWRKTENVKESQSKVYKCVSENGEDLCRETRERIKHYFANYNNCQCEPLPAPVAPPDDRV